MVYVRDILIGKNKDKSKFYMLNFGVMVVKEFEIIDEEFVWYLLNVNYIVL